MKKNLFAILFLVFMAAMGGASVAGFLKTHPYGGVLESPDVPVVHSFAEQYPFHEKKKSKQKSTIQKYSSTAKNIVSRIEWNTNDYNTLSSIISKVLSPFNQYSQGDIILNGNNPIVALPRGYFSSLFIYSRPVESWENQKDFDKWLKGQDIKYLSLITADIGDDTYTVFPEGIPHGYARMAVEYKSFLEENNIEYLESRERLITHNSDFFYWFYKTDHHWNVHAGFTMAEETAKRLNEMNINADTDAVSEIHFKLTTYPKSFLGSFGHNLGAEYKEDLEVYFPKGKTSFRMQIPSVGTDRCDSFDKTLINSRFLSSDNSSYCAFFNGNPPLIRVENMLSDNTTRALVIKHSKADIFCPYFAFTIRYLDVIDPRHFDGSIRTFIEKTKPDIVITCVDVPYEGNEEFWTLQ